MPSPTDTLLRIHDSPVPTQTTLGFLGSIVTAPIDCTGWRSKTGLNVVPPFTDFHTPPLAAPMLRAPSPAMVSESTTAAGAVAGCCATASTSKRVFMDGPPGAPGARTA